MDYKIIPLIDKFKDPIYYVLVQINLNGSPISEEVIYEHDRIHGKFNFGKLEDIIMRLPNAYQNTLKTEVIKAIFES